MKQTWLDLLFAHWRVPVESLRPLIPGKLSLETFDGSAWLGIVPFRIAGSRFRLGEVPILPPFPELNVRTYVRLGDKPGVWFFSLDAASLLAVAGARALYQLPYYPARMEAKRSAEGMIMYSSERTASTARFRCSYMPRGEPRNPQRESLEEFLTERYRLYTSLAGRLLYCDIHHAPWDLRDAECSIEENGMARALGIELEGEPVLHFSERRSVLIWPLLPAIG